jgi:hypothetical protein
MSFNVEELKIKLQPFGDLSYVLNDENILEFVVENVNYIYAVSNFGVFIEKEVLPYYSNLVVLSMDRIRLKGVFTS